MHLIIIKSSPSNCTTGPMSSVGESCPIGRYFSGWAKHDSGGWSHQIAVLSCALALAAVSNRSLILPNNLIFPRGHSFSKRDEAITFNVSVDMDRMASFNNNTVVILESVFRQKLKSLNSSFHSKYIPAVLKHADFKNCTHIRALKEPVCLYSHRSNYYYMFNYCQKSSIYPKCLAQPLDYIRPLPSIVSLSKAIANRIQPFVHLHVRRGDKGKGKETEPRNIQHTLISKGYLANRSVNVWLGTDEKSHGFFEPLYDSYRIHTLSTFVFDEAGNSNGEANSLTLSHHLLGRVRNHSLYSVQVDYLMAEYAVDKIDNKDLRMNCCYY